MFLTTNTCDGKRDCIKQCPTKAIRFINGRITKSFLIKENERAYNAATTLNCRIKCAGCGATCYGEGVCFEKR